tara:strand:- start:98 stop:271 length:174 start_codon:yes stop_codon:yes gene_type:complete
MNKRENSLLFLGIAGLAAMIVLSGCGNTISGIGKDITTVGTKVSEWQNKKSEEQKSD